MMMVPNMWAGNSPRPSLEYAGSQPPPEERPAAQLSEKRPQTACALGSESPSY